MNATAERMIKLNAEYGRIHGGTKSQTTKEQDMNTQTDLIKVRAGSFDEIHYSAKRSGKNRRPICGQTSRIAYFTPMCDQDTAEVTCEKCLAH